MATKKFIIEVEEGNTECNICPYALKDSNGLLANCIGTKHSYCTKYNLATMKITEYNEPTCYDLTCLGRKPNLKKEEK